MANEMYKLSVGGVDYPIYSEGVKLIGMSSASSLTDGFYPIVFSSNIGNATSGSSSYQKLYTDTAVGTIGYNPNTNVFWADSVKTSKLMIPTTSGGTTYGVGSNGQVLKSNGTTVYWASDSNTTYSAGTGLTLDSNTKTFAAKLTSTTAATYDSVTASNVSGRQYPVVVDKSGYLSVNVPWTDANTWRGISDIYTSTDSASSDTAFSRKGANTMYTALLNGHAGTADKLVSSGTAINLGSATAPVYFKNGVPVACTAYADASVKSATSATTAGTADKLSTSTKGSATNPVYFADGVPVACTYELNKTVPSNAVFTDTDTKVTSADNHYTPSANTASALSATTNTNNTAGSAVDWSGKVITGVSLARDAKGHVTGVNVTTGTIPAKPADTADVKVTNTLNTSTKYYVTGTTSATTNTGTQIFDTGVYVDTTAGKLVATEFSGPLTGNASSASVAGKLSNCKTAALTGAVTGSVSWDGSSDLSIATTLTSHTHDDRYYTESEINTKLANKSDKDHTHDYASSSHNHDDRYYTESEMNTKLAGKSDTGHNHNGAYLKPARFNTTSQNIPYIKININSENAWMMGFNVRVYQSYSFYEIRFSGYQYGNSYWYTPAASLVDGDGEINVFFGYDAVKKLWVGISGGDYTGVEITNVTNGYNSAGKIEDLSSLFTITNVTSLGGTTQKTLTLKPPTKSNHTHDVSATTTTAATVASSTHTHTGTTGGASNTSASVAASGHTHGTDNPGGHTHSVSGTNTASGGHTHTINANASSNRVNVAAIAHTHSTSTHDGHTHSISSTATTSAGGHGHTINAAADNTTNRVTVAASGHTHGGSTSSISGTSTVTTSGHTHSTSSHDGHTHSVSGTAASAGAHTHTTSGTAASNGAHTHTTSGTVTLSCSVSTAAILTITPSFSGNATGSAGGHTHSVSGTAASAGAHTHTTSGTAASAGAHSHTANSTASDYHITVASNAHTHGLSVTASGTTGVSVATGAHTHTTVDNGAHTHNFSATTSSAGSHSHTATATSTTDYQVSVATGAHSHTAVAVDDHNHTFTGNATGSAGGHTHTVNASGTAAVSVPNGNHTHSFTSAAPSATATVAAQGHTHVTGAAK